MFFTAICLHLFTRLLAEHPDLHCHAIDGCDSDVVSALSINRDVYNRDIYGQATQPPQPSDSQRSARQRAQLIHEDLVSSTTTIDAQLRDPRVAESSADSLAQEARASAQQAQQHALTWDVTVCQRTNDEIECHQNYIFCYWDGHLCMDNVYDVHYNSDGKTLFINIRDPNQTIQDSFFKSPNSPAAIVIRTMGCYDLNPSSDRMKLQQSLDVGGIGWLTNGCAGYGSGVFVHYGLLNTAKINDGEYSECMYRFPIEEACNSGMGSVGLMDQSDTVYISLPWGPGDGKLDKAWTASQNFNKRGYASTKYVGFFSSKCTMETMLKQTGGAPGPCPANVSCPAISKHVTSLNQFLLSNDCACKYNGTAHSPTWGACVPSGPTPSPPPGPSDECGTFSCHTFGPEGWDTPCEDHAKWLHDHIGTGATEGNLTIFANLLVAGQCPSGCGGCFKDPSLPYTAASSKCGHWSCKTFSGGDASETCMTHIDYLVTQVGIKHTFAVDIVKYQCPGDCGGCRGGSDDKAEEQFLDNGSVLEGPSSLP